MSKARLLDLVKSERRVWDALIVEVGRDRMATPGAAGDWTLKDVIAHITWHEREVAGSFGARSMAVGSDLWYLPIHERNAAIYDLHRDLPLDHVLSESKAAFKEMLLVLDNLEEADLHDPARIAEMPADWIPWRIIAENTYEHYADHAAALRTDRGR